MTRVIATIILVFSILVSFACVQPGGNTSTPSTGDTIKVGVFLDLSGQTSSFGQSAKNGAELAADEINNAGGVSGKKIELIVQDDQGRPDPARAIVSKFVNEDKVQAVIGEVSSTNSLAAAPIAQEAKVPMITPASTNPRVTEIGDYISRVCFIDPFQGSVMAKFASNTLKAKTAAIFGDVNSDYSKGLTQFFEDEFTRLGGKVVTKEAYAQTSEPDYKEQLTKIKALNPDVIYIPGYYGQVGVIVREARELGMKMPLLGGDGWDSPQLWKLGGDALNNTYMSNHYSAENPAPEIQNFVKAYKAKYNVVPDAPAALSYDAVKVLADAIKRAGGTDSGKLKDAINATKDFDGVTGKITIDSKRNAVKPAVVLQLDPAAGAFRYKETISPEGSGTASSNSNSMPNNTATNGNSMTNMASPANAVANIAPSAANAANTR